MAESEAATGVPVAVALAKSYLLLNHGPLTLVSSAAGGQSNVMAAAWAMPLDFDPPKVLLVLDKQTLTRTLVDTSGEFALNIPCRAMAAQVLAVGSVSGRLGDKFARMGWQTFAASKISAPLITGCNAWLECRVLQNEANQTRHDLFIAEVLAAWSDPAVFSHGRWHFPNEERRTIHYQAGGSFFVTGDAFTCAEGQD